MISIDSSMSDMAQIEAAQAASRPPEMPSADTGKPEVAKADEKVEAVAEVDEGGTDPGDDGGSSADADTDAKQKKNGFRRKIWFRDQEIAALKAKVEALSVGGVKTAEDTEPPQYQPQSTEGKPTLTQFDGDLDKFTEALYDWKSEQKAIEAQAKLQAETWQSRVADAAKEFTDFDEYADTQIPLTPQMREFLVDSEIGPKLGYTLAKDMAEAQRIFGLSPVQQLKALTKLELQLTGTPPPPVQQLTKASAPPPIRPLAGGSTTSVVKDPRRSDMSFQEHLAWRNSGGK